MIEIGLAVLKNRWGMLAVGMFAAYLYGLYSIEMPDIAAIERNAALGRDAEWTRLLAQKERDHEARVAAAVAAAEYEPDLPADYAERLRVCRASSTCRDRGR
jgi:hypothetical protein